MITWLLKGVINIKRRLCQLAATLLLLTCLWPSPSIAAPQYRQVVDYDIKVKLDDAITTLTGEESIIWTNITNRPTSILYLHLYPNAFAEGSTFLQESGGMLRGDRMSKEGYGHMHITRLQSSGQDLTWGFVQPDDGNPADRTLARVDLPRPVNPGESLRLYIEFEVKLPQVFARMGRYSQFAMAGQWYPKIAVYEPAGVRDRAEAGWEAHQYHGNTEFYADFGSYRVRIDVPITHTVAATGNLLNQSVSTGNRRVYTYRAERVHDFVWATDNDFEVKTATFSNSVQPPVRIQVYLQPEHADLAEVYLHAGREALDHLSKWLGPYPYDVLSLVCPTAGASGAGGMEYPTLVTGWDASIKDEQLIALVLVHEITHQYFYGLVASNEFEEAWLDEGFTSYIEDKIMQSAYGVPINPADDAFGVPEAYPLVLDGWKYPGADAYASNVYTRGKLVLHELERRLGWERLQAALRTYVDRYRFKHPSTRDFQRVLEQTAGQNLTAFFEHYVYGSGMDDYAIENVVSRRSNGEHTYLTEVSVSRATGLIQPVRLLAWFKDGSTQELVWEADSESAILSFSHNSTLTGVELDPAPHVLILDNVRINNFYALRSNSRLQIWLSYLLQLLSQWIGW